MCIVSIKHEITELGFFSRTEDEIGTDNFHDLDVPEDLIDKFKKMDEAYLS